MAEIRVNVTASKSQRVNVSSSNIATEITATPDTSQYYSNLSKNWAIAENIVDGKDYSSKHYAKEAQQASALANTYKEATEQAYISFSEQYANAETELTAIKDASVQEINTAVADGKTEITTAKDLAVDAVNSTKTTILNDIEFVADGEKEEIRDIIDTGKDDLKESIKDLKVLTTLEIGDIGIAPLGIDESKGKRRYLNGQLIIQEQYVQFTNKVKSAVALYPSLACTESEWQTTATMTVGGQVGKFVIDDEAGTIRLPKIIMPIQGLTDLSKLGQIVNAGLPNIVGAFGDVVQSVGAGASGAFNWYSANAQTNANAGTLQPLYNVDFYASRSSAIYGNSSTVQQEQIQYPYFIQVATGAEIEDNIVNEIELNNPFSLLDYKYSEYELNNLSWLRSEGQYNSKAVYPAVYDLLLKIYNGTETKAGVSVKLSTEAFTDYDFVLNTAEETFRLPIKVNLASGKAVVGNGMTLGLSNGNGGVGLYSNQQGNLYGFAEGYGINVGSKPSTINYYQDFTLGLTTDATKSGIETSDSGLYLYFYVGETVQNANLINAGRIEEKVASLIPDNSSLISSYSMPSNKYIDLTLGASGSTYTAPANGWLCLAKLTTNYNQYVQFNATEGNLSPRSNFLVGSEVYNNSGLAYAFMPMSKGQSTKVYYNAGGTVYAFRFIYAQGEV